MGKGRKRRSPKERTTRKYGWKKRSKMLKQPKATMEKTEQTLVYFWSSKSPTGGHASMKLPNGVYISFRSRDTKYKVKVDNPHYPSRLDDDVTEEGKAPDTILEIDGSKLNEEFVLSWWLRFKEEKIFLLQHQSCQVIYNAIYAGGGTVSEPLHWTPFELERYVRRLSRQPQKNLFGDMFTFEWFSEMDAISKILFFLMIALLLGLAVMALHRIPPNENESWTCFNDYEVCNQYVKRFHRGDNSSVQNLLKENSGPILQFALGIGVIFICTRISMDDLMRFALHRKIKNDDDDDDDEIEDGDHDDGGDEDDDEDGVSNDDDVDSLENGFQICAKEVSVT